ncbi:MAG: enterotoxin [Planctomycetota bacterium]|nr:enterotoxin [Planctomycetota bacterium]
MSTIAKLSITLSLMLASAGVATCIAAVDYPGTPPAAAACDADERQMQLANDVIRCRWVLRDGCAKSLEITDLSAGDTVALRSGYMPRIVLGDGRLVDLAAISPTRPFHCDVIKPDSPQSPRAEKAHGGRRLSARFLDSRFGLTVDWSADLRDGSNYVNQTLALQTGRDVKIERIDFLHGAIELDGVIGQHGAVEKAEQVGRVGGSVVVCRNIFLAVENPLAENVVTSGSSVRCSLPRSITLRAGQAAWRFSSVAGVVPAGQLRRGFLYYLERRRAHPYRPFLHYNSWYHLNIGRPMCRMVEKECLDTIEHVGRELVKKRGTRLDAFVWDDGWDDHNTLWKFHDGFPRGFSETFKAGKAYGAATGVWLSPWGGYGARHKARIAYGKKQGLEINDGKFSLSGARYYAAFRDSCLEMIRKYNAAFFKFDGMGRTNMTSGESGKNAEDIDAVLRLVGELRQEKPDIFISATTGTWASPFWTLFADSIWRQGSDVGYHGAGNHRQQWITYRDMLAYQRVVLRGPLYPLNSVMFHGLCVGEHATPAKMPRDEKSVIDETWMMFGCGTGLQELYISPHLLTPAMWDELAKAAKWSRANSDVLVDTHWIGGDPGKAQIYGFAAWSPAKATLVLRNPSDKTQSFEFTPRRDWEIPKGVDATCKLRTIHGKSQTAVPKTVPADGALKITLEPFGIVFIEGLSDGL